VDKYAPRSFTQLLSPEKINREVLKALKKWDRFVFKTDNHTGTIKIAIALCPGSS
jgi:chromosome transmission fidelity protein 18